MTKILNTTTNETHNIRLVDRDSGADFLSDVIGSMNQSDEWLDAIPEDREDVEFAMSDEDVRWWERWAEREQRINDEYDKADEAMRERISTTYSDYDYDMELPQDKVFELLGIEE